jgi:regulatory protein
MSLTITRIEPQKRKKNRYSIFASDQFITGVSDQTLLDFNLHLGEKLTQKKLDKINERETYLHLREQAMRFLARRAHSKREMWLKLYNKGFDKPRINQIIEELEKKKYLDDNHFAQMFIQDEIQLKKTGPLRIRQKLREKGVENEITEELLKELYPEELQTKHVAELAQKKLKTLKEKPAARIQKQLASYLINKGYTWQITGPVLRQLTGELSDE